jgi:hypothetical protein
MPEQPVTLRDEIFLDVCRPLADATDAQPVFAPALPDLDEHLPTLADRAVFGDVLVDLFDEHEKRLFLLLCLREETPGNGGQNLLCFTLVEIARDIENDGDVLFECECRDLFRVVGRHLDITLLVAAGVEDLVLLFEAVVLAVDIDDQEAEAVVEQFLGDDTRRVRFATAGFPRDEATAGQQFDDRQGDLSPGFLRPTEAVAGLGNSNPFRFSHTRNSTNRLV